MLQLLAIGFGRAKLLFEEGEASCFALVSLGAFLGRLLTERLDLAERFVEPCVLLLNELNQLGAFGSLLVELPGSLGELVTTDAEFIAFTDQFVAEPLHIAVQLVNQVIEGGALLAEQSRGFCHEAEGCGRRLIRGR